MQSAHQRWKFTAINHTAGTCCTPRHQTRGRCATCKIVPLKDMLQYRQYSEHLLGAPAAIDDHTINVDKPNTPTLLRRRTPRNSNFLHENDNSGPAHPQEERDVEENPQPLVNPALPAPPNSPPRPKVASVGPSVPTNATGKERATDDGCEGLGSSQQPALTPPPQTVVLTLTDTMAQRRRDLHISRSGQQISIQLLVPT